MFRNKYGAMHGHGSAQFGERFFHHVQFRVGSFATVLCPPPQKPPRRSAEIRLDEPPIRQTLASRAFDRKRSPFPIVGAWCDTV
jgi:hypothetical protein